MQSPPSGYACVNLGSYVFFAVSFLLTPHTTRQCACSQVLSTAVKPVLLGGPRLRHSTRREAFLELADAMGCAVAVTADAKGLFPEDHPNFIGEL